MNIMLDVVFANAINQGRETKGTQSGKGEMKLFSVHRRQDHLYRIFKRIFFLNHC